MTSSQPTPNYSSAASLGHSPHFLQQRKMLMTVPLLALPFLFFMFYSLGGGKGDTKNNTAGGKGMGFNPELPKPQSDRKKQVKNKLDFYQQAEQDSLKRRALLQQDPYHRPNPDSSASPSIRGNTLLPEDPRADEMMKRLDQLRQSIQTPVPVNREIPRSYTEAPPIPRYRPPLQELPPDTGETDPQLEKLNTMLDKIIRIQHPGQDPPAEPSPDHRNTTASPSTPDVEAARSIPAVINQDQTLVTGATVALQLTEAVNLNGIPIPAHQMIYGIASLNNDRLQININSIRYGQAIYPVALQVYDMDGIPGIHIPGTLGREVAKQSADQGISSINLNSLDPSPGAQATNAGIQAAKTLLSRKVRLIRVSVRAGYQVLLRSTGQGSRIRVNLPAVDSISLSIDSLHDFIPYLHHRTRNEKMQLLLRGIYLQDNILFFSLYLRNQSPIDYLPESTRWWIRDRRQWKRTAVQEIPIQPLYASALPMVKGDSTGTLFVGFRPFALPRDKELVLQIAEKNGARELVLTINHQEILTAKRQSP